MIFEPFTNKHSSSNIQNLEQRIIICSTNCVAEIIETNPHLQGSTSHDVPPKQKNTPFFHSIDLKLECPTGKLNFFTKLRNFNWFLWRQFPRGRNTDTCCIYAECHISYIIHMSICKYIYISLSKHMGNVNRRTSCENRHWKLLQSRTRIRRSLGTAVCFHPGSGTVGQVMSCNTALVKARGIPSSISKLTNCNLFFNMSMILIQFRLFFNMSSFIKSKHLDTTRLIRSRWVTKGIDHLGFNLTPSGVCAVAVIKSQETAAAKTKKAKRQKTQHVIP